MKPTPLSAMLADDLLLDRVGARLDADDELGSLLLAVAHRADTPIPRATLARRVRPHRGLTVFAALGVAVSGATVAAAVELAPVPPDQASGVPHARAFLPPSLQALVLPFLSGSPFQGRLVLPFGALPGVPFDGSMAALGLPATALPSAGLMEPLSVATQEAQLDKREHEDQQDAQRQKVQAKGTPATGQGQTPAPADDQGEDETTEPVEAAPEPKPKPTPTPTSMPTVGGATTGTINGANGQVNGANGQANGAGNGQSHGRGAGGTPTGDPTGGTGTGETTGDMSGTTSGTNSGTDGTGTVDDDPITGAPAKGKAKAAAVTGAAVVVGTTRAGSGTTAGIMTPAPTSTAATTGSSSTSAGSGGQ